MMEYLIIFIGIAFGTLIGTFFGVYGGMLITQAKWEHKTLSRTEKAYLITLPILCILALIYLIL